MEYMNKNEEALGLTNNVVDEEEINKSKEYLFWAVEKIALVNILI